MTEERPTGQSANGARRTRIAVYLICVAYTVTRALFAFRETPGRQLFSICCFLALVVSVVLYFAHAARSWGRLRWRVLVPFAVVLVALAGAGDVGRFVRDRYFQRRIPMLEEAIQAYRVNGDSLEAAWRGRRVTAERLGGEVAIVFWWGGGFPVKHTVLAYYSGADPKPFFREGGWRRGYSVQRHWWVLKD